jgi:tetratricopeptide (TPR) repeat protein
LRSTSDCAGQPNDHAYRPGKAIHNAGQADDARSPEEGLCSQLTRRDFSVGQSVSSSTTRATYRIYDVKKGGCGAVYIATEEQTGRSVALKTFQSKFLWSDESRNRFEREALTWLMLGKHPNIVTANVILRIEGFPCLELEFLSGGDLATRLRKGPLAPLRAVELALNFCDGMNYAHQEMGLVHRDVKPANCLLDERGNLKVADWGLARTFTYPNDEPMDQEDRGGNPFNHTAALGTTYYMAPEQRRKNATLDSRVDIYAAGIMLFEMLTGLNENRDGTFPEEFESKGGKLSVPAALRDLITQCVQPDPSCRPANFGELRSKLASIYQSLADRMPPPPPQPAPMSKADWKDKGIALGVLGHYEYEILCYDRGLEIDDADAELWKNRGVALRLLGRTREALWCYDRGLKFAPDDTGLLLNKGVALGYEGEFKKEIECYDKALQTAPRDSALWKNKGVALGELGRYDEELQCYNRALESAARDTDLWQNKGVTLRILGRYQEAIECYRHALTISPRNSNLWKNLGAAWAGLKRHDEAIKCYEQGLQINPQDEQLWRNKGVALGAQRRHVEEIECYEKGLELAPHDSALWRYKGLALCCLNRNSEAQACLLRASELELGKEPSPVFCRD